MSKENQRWLGKEGMKNHCSSSRLVLAFKLSRAHGKFCDVRR